MSHILIVHRDAGFARNVTRHLTASGHIVAWTRDGHSTLGKLVKFQPDLILLDDGLTDVPALTLCATLRQLRATERLPIVLVGSRREADDWRAAVEAGCDDLIALPCELEDLGARVQAQLVVAHHFRDYRTTLLTSFPRK